MTYHCGIAFDGNPPTFTCDGCGARYVVTGRGAGGNIPPSWFLNKKAPPKWRKVPGPEKARHYCPRCKEGVSDE